MSGLRNAVVKPLGAGLPDYRAAPYCPWCGHKTHVLNCEREEPIPCCAGVKWGPCACHGRQHMVCEHDLPFGICPTCFPPIQLGTCRVYRHGGAQAAISRGVETDLPHPKQHNCLDWKLSSPAPRPPRES